MSYTNKDFNPSNCTSVDAIKSAAEVLATTIVANSPAGALREKAIIDVQSASMFAVKALFS